MDTIPVILIVKAPNQQIEDQTIQCELSWTIKRLKGYLSEVYPSKPRTEEQKLIYSGQLLPDSVVLKDVLRRYEGQETHTVHLVCTPSREVFHVKSAVKPAKRDLPTDMAQTDIAHTAPTPTANASQINEQIPTPTPSSSSDNVTPSCSNCPSLESVANNAGSTQEVPITPTADARPAWTGPMGQPYITQFPDDPNSYIAQMAWFQHAYANYVTQYMQFYSNGLGPNVLNANTDANQDNLPLNRENRRIINNAAPAAANAPLAAAPEIVNAAVNEEEGIIDRDWLDWFYVLGRVVVLLSIVYFYSSPLRFIFVVVLGCTMYLYQMGFFRGQFDNNVNNNNVDDGAENNNNNNNRRNARRAGVEPNAGDNEQPAAGQPQPTPAEEERPTVFGVMWTFFITFFASLIPEVPNPV